MDHDNRANNSYPPNRFVQWLVDTDGTTRLFGFAIGYNSNIGLGKAAYRTVNNVNDCYFGQVTVSVLAPKTYPFLVNGASTTYADGILHANTCYDAVAFRCPLSPLNFALQPHARCVYWYQVGQDIYLQVDYPSTAALTEYITLPSWMTGMKITPLTNEGTGITVNSAFVTPLGINITTAATTNCTAILHLQPPSLF
jgi:hypothetical protein